MIYTFYSYKGGVGRSMALANVAELLYRVGLRVLVVDWDLEAPGLERFFPEYKQAALEKLGLINLFLDYK
jgi:MinD-like ATPase involved in chromosome partitioning or flagellar assembly